MRSNLWYCDGGCYHPHLHLLATSGGYDDQGERWEHLNYLPYDLLRRKWQWHLLSMLRKTLKQMFHPKPHKSMAVKYRTFNVLPDVLATPFY